MGSLGTTYKLTRFDEHGRVRAEVTVNRFDLDRTIALVTGESLSRSAVVQIINGRPRVIRLGDDDLLIELVR